MPRFGRFRDALKMVKVAEIIDTTMRLQLKLTPLRHIFAMRTRVLVLWKSMSVIAKTWSKRRICVQDLWRSLFPPSPHASLESALLGMLGSEGLVDALAFQVPSKRSSTGKLESMALLRRQRTSASMVGCRRHSRSPRLTAVVEA